MRYGNHNPAGRQRPLQADLPRSLADLHQHQPRYGTAMCRRSLTRCSAVALQSRAIPRICARTAWKKRVAFSCKSSFCLSCCKVYIDEWVSHIGRTLYEGVSYRHVVLTMPDALHIEFYRRRVLLADLMKCGVAMLHDALSWFKKVEPRLAT